jgi:hypothetical protein
MTLDPERALTGAIFAYLRADHGLATVLGDPPRVYDAPPPDPIYPYLTLSRGQAKPWGGVEGEGVEHALTLTALSEFDGLEEARQIGALVRASLDEAALTLADHRLVNLRVSFVDVFRAADWLSSFAVLRLRAVTEPL